MALASWFKYTLVASWGGQNRQEFSQEKKWFRLANIDPLKKPWICSSSDPQVQLRTRNLKNCHYRTVQFSLKKNPKTYLGHCASQFSASVSLLTRRATTIKNYHPETDFVCTKREANNDILYAKEQANSQGSWREDGGNLQVRTSNRG